MITINNSKVLAIGEKIYIEKLEREHVDTMQRWGKHKDPMFYGYNIPYMSENERTCWYKNKTLPFSKKCFSIFNISSQLIGYISLRNIKWIRKSSELGIVFDPNNISKGYGTDSLNVFLEYYFDILKMKSLYLKVAIFNIRAQRCYEKCGFKPKGIVIEEFEDQSIPILKNDYFIPYRDYFIQEGKKIKCKYINMIITKDMYYKDKNKI